MEFRKEEVLDVMDISCSEEEMLLTEEGSLRVDINVDFKIDLSIFISQIIKGDGSICETLARILELSVLSMEFSNEDGKELEEISWVVVRILALIDLAAHKLLFVDLSLFDLIIEMLYSSPVVIVDRVIRLEDLLMSLFFIFSQVLN